ncbi:TonB-dependent receptor [Aliiglaciecola sp. LCG003]|uniref:TonB-dependent receptor domain-containing protein n=1 Tax=Aliiglaciecola sp. LCG003 TaxID=3053655 RepID=UPI00257439B6|nr:TonB-dependent receptor [Aliiglaciecola sp. LCG003]WJG11228.1 TonB-dependent receptor [Aliiglaciecola sp. LCG003]
MAQEPEMPDSEADAIEEITVVGRSVSYANNATSEQMVKQQTSMTSVLAAIDNLPGVLVNEGDTFGSDDWSTSISIRGFQVDLGQQQIGITVDGIANGNSNYGGGAKANRYIDTENLGLVEVSQGTADISSRSNEALGGTINFTTVDPGTEERFVVSSTFGEFDAQKFFVRYETGEIAKDTYAWFSMSTQENSDWIDQVAENTRDHFAAKVISSISDVEFTAYMSYDDTHEDNYQRVYSVAQFEQNPNWDGLTSDWTGNPYQDQVYRKGWSTLRENFFTYLQADFNVGPVAFQTNVYYHDNEGRGDWVPPYIVNVTDNGEGNSHSELVSGNTVYGGAFLGQIFFVDNNGVQLSPIDGCQSSIAFPYGGAGPQYDGGCYEQGAIPVGSYRHTHYSKTRTGVNADFIWDTEIAGMANTLRGGFWYENYNREESRDWHKIIDSATSYRFYHKPYWVQYDREFPVDTMMFYIEDELDLGFASIRLGAKKFNVDVEKQDRFVGSNSQKLSSDSDTLLTAGFIAPMPIEGLEIFGGYSENFAAIKDSVLERDDADLRFVEPETADNIDLGLRYSSSDLSASLTFYSIKFDDRINFVSNETSSGIDFLESAAGGYNNVGGIESTGFEASLTYQFSNNFSLFMSFTDNDSEYTDTIGNDGIAYASPQAAYDQNVDNASFGLLAVKGNSVIGVADQMAVISVDWQKDNYTAGLSTKYVGERTLNVFENETVLVGENANSTVLVNSEVDSYIVSDLYVGALFDDLGESVESIEIRFTVNNLFDESYLGTIAPGAAWIGAPRTAALNLKAAF